VNQANVAELTEPQVSTNDRATSLLLCALVAMADGFDTQAIGFVAPRLATDLGIEPRAMGSIFAAGLIGLTLGALGLSVLADRIGRRPVIIGSVAAFGICALATATADSTRELLAWRFLTGLGLGGALPNVNALAAEIAPPNRRALLMTLMFAGFPLGGVIGGLASAPLLTAYDWRSVFVLGGMFPLLLVPILVWRLRESPAYGATSSTPRGRRSSPAALFRDRRAIPTIALWIACFCSLLIMYSLLNWLPSVLAAGGIPIERAIIATAIFNLGGVIGGLVLAVWLDRSGDERALAGAFVVGAAAIASMGTLPGGRSGLFALVGLAGATLIGTQLGINAAIANFYPAALRATGLGWSLGVGRIGSIVGPIAVGIVVAAQWPLATMLAALAVPALICAVAVLGFSWAKRRRAP
jgi:MFS transporter, AAHS family, 4-hydroxybenzoate transporter